MWVLIWVDDFICAATRPAVMVEIKRKLCIKFNMTDLGRIHYFLGIQIKQDSQTFGITLNQAKYVEEILIRFNMSECNPAATPVNPTVSLRLSHVDDMAKYKHNYQSAVGSLQYLTQCTRPDIAFAVQQVSKYFNNPGKVHWTAVKRILEYIKNTPNYGINYQSCTNDFKLVGYVDADLWLVVTVRVQTNTVDISSLG